MKSWALAALAAAMTSSGVGLAPAVGDVVVDRAAEQERLLQHHADLAAQVVHVHLADVHAVDE